MSNKSVSKKGNSLRRVWAVLATAFLATHLLLLMSCSSIDCPVQNFVGTYYAMMKADGKPDTLGTDTLWISTTAGTGKDSTLIDALCNNETTFVLPISYTEPENVFYTLLVDTFGNSWKDTIRITKTDTPHFESVDCQATYFHELESATITHHAFDSIVINYPHVNYDQTHNHIYLYRKVLP